jgi:hypothetical protein
LNIGATLRKLEGSSFTVDFDSKRAPCKQSISLCTSCVRGTWKEEDSFNRKYEGYVRHVKEGFGNVASLSL